MGAVYRARHRSLDSAVAIKVLPVPASVGADELERFRREAMIAARLQHPNIVPVYQFDIREDIAYLVMPLIEGVALDRRIADGGPLTWDETRVLLAQIGEALDFAHERGVIHRDVKPANILWEPANRRWLITDFGIARRAREEGHTLTATGVVVGTPAYMSPEQAASGPVDHRADLYGLGAVAYEALTGERPEAMADAPRAEAGLRSARPDIPSRRAAALAAPLALDKAERPGSVREWLARVDAAESQRGVRRMLVGITMAGVLLAAAVLSRGRTSEPAAAGAPITAVAPLALAERADHPLDAALGHQLAAAFAEQLRWLPDQRVVPVTAVDAALRERFGDAPADPDTIATYLATRFDAARTLTGAARAGTGDQLHVTVQLRDARGELLRADSAAASPDSLGDLVYGLVVSLFAEGLAREQVGWSQVLPRGATAVRAFLAARPRLRAGAYDEAVRLYSEVIAADSTFAPAYFERTLAEVLRAQPTRVNQAVRTALDAAHRFRDRLDPATRALLAGYETLVADGHVERAHDQFDSLVRHHPNAPDAWFILGSIEFHFGPLFGLDPAAARFALLRAVELAPEFAAPRGLLGWLDLADDEASAQAHLLRYLAIDSTSVFAELVRMVDSLRFRGARAALQVAASLEARPTPALELIALASSSLLLRAAEREIVGDAIRALQARATTATDRAIAFRIEMAWLLGGARLAAADSLLRAGRVQNAPRGELDAWTTLLAVTAVTPAPPTAAAVDEAVTRLAAAGDDPTAQWLAARWSRNRDPAAAAAARGRLTVLAESGGAVSLLALSLMDDLVALDALAAHDTTRARATWDGAMQRYQIEDVRFGLVASLWPLELDRARLAAARGDHDEVIQRTARFRHAVGFVDQVGRLAALPLRLDALQATDNALNARQLAERLLDLWSRADGAGTALRDSVRARVPGL
jgi:tetratricopeptide (TPR) repeat protein